MKDISGKHITILGAVRSGLAAAKLAKKLGAIPFVSDYSNADALGDNLSSLDKHAIKYETGGHTDKVFDCDFIVTSPGVPSNSDVLLKAKEKNIKVVSELEFASWFNKGTVIAITGTNGKTTTTSLCAHLLNSCGLKTHLAGNIGVAFSDIVLSVKEDEFVALEVSSFQLDFIESFKPKFALLLNLTKDHLDRYDDNFENYIKSKFNIIMNQNSKDYFIINCDDEIIANFPVRSYNNYCFSMGQAHSDGCFIEEGRFYFRMNHEITEIGGVENLSIKGEHNQYNALA
ncbi:MAG: UDP-N-acetylmuramoyl-L-alanine--D-glutamate ligase, partial [Melioribacteraceae bacterium]|nr:UDP-N-acetylmuramoyl-L-alanine--D-glutamate ligase [Melioribacteraceae bacterium]